MRFVMAISLALISSLLSSPAARAAIDSLEAFTCKEVADNVRDHKITLRLGIAKAEVENYWADARKDNGELKANKSNGDRVYKGFSHWVADGVEGSGYLYVSRRLLKEGTGKAALYNRFCGGANCITRTAKLECRETVPTRGVKSLPPGVYGPPRP